MRGSLPLRCVFSIGSLLAFFILLFIFLSFVYVYAKEEAGTKEEVKGIEISLDAEKIGELRADIENKLPQVTLTPDIPFYFLKNIWEDIRVFLIRETEKRVQLQINYAEERLAEALVEADKGKYHIADKLLDSYEQEMEKIKKDLEGLKDDKIDTSKLIENVVISIYKEQAVIKEIEEMEESLEGDEEDKMRTEVMKNRGIYRAKNYLKEIFTLRVKSDDFEPPFLTPVPSPAGKKIDNQGGEK